MRTRTDLKGGLTPGEHKQINRSYPSYIFPRYRPVPPPPSGPIPIPYPNIQSNSPIS
jgi:hypothetical protein